MASIALNSGLQNRLQTNASASLLRKLSLILIGNCLLALSAQVAIPLQPVPVTLQSLAVLFIGMAYGWRLGGITVLTYLLEGACGLPIFANALGGLTVFLTPSVGYLIGFLPGAVVSGYLAERGCGRSIRGAALAGFAGLALIYAGGFSVLAAMIGLQHAWSVGIQPFLLIDATKVVLVASMIPLFWRKRA